MQKLSVTLTIPIPEDSVIIKKVEYEKLKQNELQGVYWTMKDLEKKVNRKHDWIKENILYPSRCNRQVELNNFPQIILNSFLQLRFNSLLN